MNKLHELKWFDEQRATEVRDATRELVRLYCEALEAVSALPRPFQRVKFYGVRSGQRPLLVVKSFLRDVVVDHIRTVLRHSALLHLRAFAAARPLPAEVRLGVKRTAEAELVARAEARRAEFLARQQKIAAPLREAAQDIHDLGELIGDEERPGQRALKAVLRLVRRGLPFLWAGWVLAQFDRWSDSPQLQLFFFFVGTAVIYHLTAWLTLPFHDAGERKYVLFEGYTGKASDGLDPLHPEASRLEKALFKQFGLRPPVVISWETVIPILHYGLICALIVVLWIKLPLAPVARSLAAVFGLVLIVVYLSQLFALWTLLNLRYRDRPIWEIASALLSSFQSLEPFDDSAEGSEAEDGKDGA